MAKKSNLQNISRKIESKHMLKRLKRDEEKIDEAELKERGKQCKDMAIASGAFGAASEHLSFAGDVASSIPVLGWVANGLLKGAAAATNLVKNGLNIASTAIDCDQVPFDELKLHIDKQYNKMDKKLDKLSEKLDEISKKVDAIYLSVQKLGMELRAGIKKIINTIKDLDLENKIDDVKSNARLYELEMEAIRNLSKKKYLSQLLDDNSIFKRLENMKDQARLWVPMNKLCENVNKILKKKEDDVPLSAIDAILKGTQVFASVMGFHIEQHLRSANHYYISGNLEKYNQQISEIQHVYNIYYFYLIENKDWPLIGYSKYILKAYNSKYKNATLFDEKIKFLSDLEDNVKQLKLEILTPDNGISIKFSKFKDDNTTESRCKIKQELTYAMQFKQDGFYSEISKWTKPVMIEKGNVTLSIPNDSNRDRLIFRRYGKNNAEYVGIVKKSQTEFWDINRDFYNAARNPSQVEAKDEIDLYLKRGANVNAKFEDGRSAIHSASQAGHREVARLLVRNGADVNQADDKGYTPLHLAAESDSLSLTRFLIRKKANLTAKSKYEEQTPLHLASRKGFITLIEVLMEKETVNEEDKFGFTPFHLATIGGVETVKIFLTKSSQYQIDINAQAGSEKLTPLHLAVIHGDPKIVESLLKHELLNMNIKDKQNLTPLHYACLAPPSANNLKIVESLVDNPKTETNIASEKNWTALHFALFNRNKRAALKLLESGKTDLSSRLEGGITLLHLSTSTGAIDVVKKLLEKKVSIDSVTDDGYTALHLGAMRKEHEIVPLLVEKGAKVEERAKDGSTPLHFAAKAGQVETVKYLLTKGASISIENEAGQYPIHEAVSHGQLEVTKVFLDKNIEMLYEQNRSNETLFDIAINRYVKAAGFRFDKNQKLNMMFEKVSQNFIGDKVRDEEHNSDKKKQLYESIIKELVRRGLDVNRWYGEGRPPLHFFAMMGSLEMIEFFLSNNADPNALDFTHQYFFNLAIEYGQKNIVEYAFDNKIFSFSENLVDALCVAIEYGHLDVIKYIVGTQKLLLCDPLQNSALHGHLSIVQYLVEEEGMDVDSVGNWLTPLCGAVREGHIHIVRYLLNRGAGVLNECGRGMGDALHFATTFHHNDIYRMLANMIDPNKIDSTGYNKLHYAVRFECYECVKYLIEQRKANIDMQDKYGNTALHLACYITENRIPIYRFLLEKGTDITIENNRGFTARVEHCFLKILTKTKEGHDRYMELVQSKGYKNEREKQLALLQYAEVLSSKNNTTSFKYRRNVNHFHEMNLFYPQKFATALKPLLKDKENDAKFFEENIQQKRMMQFDHRSSKFVKNAGIKTFDVNSTLLLLDTLTRKVTQKKHVPHLDDSMSDMEAKAEALLITEAIEKFLFSMDKSEDIDFSEVHSNVFKALMSGREHKIPEIFYNLISNNTKGN